jgi:hypothetical protein
MVNVVNHLLSYGVLQQRDGQWVVQDEERTATALPENLRQLIEQQLARVSSDETQDFRDGKCGGSGILSRCGSGRSGAIYRSSRNTL